MKKTILSVIGSAALISLTSSFALAQTSAPTTNPPATTPPADTPAAPATTTTPSAPTTAPVTTTTPAQSSKPSGKVPARLQAKLAKVSAAVGLTPEQQSQVLAIYVDEYKQIRATKDKAEIAKIRDAADAKIVALLTPEQNKKYTEFKHPKKA